MLVQLSPKSVEMYTPPGVAAANVREEEGSSCKLGITDGGAKFDFLPPKNGLSTRQQGCDTNL